MFQVKEIYVTGEKEELCLPFDKWHSKTLRQTIKSTFAYEMFPVFRS